MATVERFGPSVNPAEFSDSEDRLERRIPANGDGASGKDEVPGLWTRGICSGPIWSRWNPKEKNRPWKFQDIEHLYSATKLLWLDRSPQCPSNPTGARQTVLLLVVRLRLARTESSSFSFPFWRSFARCSPADAYPRPLWLPRRHSLPIPLVSSTPDDFVTSSFLSALGLSGSHGV